MATDPQILGAAEDKAVQEERLRITSPTETSERASRVA